MAMMRCSWSVNTDLDEVGAKAIKEMTVEVESKNAQSFCRHAYDFSPELP